MMSDSKPGKAPYIIAGVGLLVLFGFMLLLNSLPATLFVRAADTPRPTRPTPTPFPNYTPRPSLSDDPADFVDTIGGWTCESDGFGSTTISGRVENDHPTKALESVRLRGRIEFDGRVINTTTSLLDSDLLRPGATSTYDIFIDNPDNEDVRCFVSVESARFEN